MSGNQNITLQAVWVAGDGSDSIIFPAAFGGNDSSSTLLTADSTYVIDAAYSTLITDLLLTAYDQDGDPLLVVWMKFESDQHVTIEMKL